MLQRKKYSIGTRRDSLQSLLTKLSASLYLRRVPEFNKGKEREERNKIITFSNISISFSLSFSP
ncbi:hypothetical protein Hanom_Chr14g01315811 [Helianthus anomalus]